MRSFPSLIFTLSLSFSSAQAYINLGSAGTFGALSYASITNSGPTDLVGDIGTTGSSIVGFPPGVYTGSRYVISQAISAFEAAEAAYEAVASLPDAILLVGNLGGKSLPPGVYKYPSSAQLSGILTLAGTGSSDDAWYFQIGSTLTTSIGSEVVITGGGKPCNVFWKVGTSATLGLGSTFVGSVLAAVSITASAEATSIGGLFALGASISLNSNFIQAQYCPAPATPPSSSSSLPSSTSSAAASSTYLSSSSSFSSAAQSSTSTSSSAAPSSTSALPSSSSAAASSSSYPSSSSSAAQSSTSSAPPSTSSMPTSSSSAAPTSTTPVVPTHVPSVGSCVRIGCYTEGNVSRALTPYAYADYDLMSPELCASYCPDSTYFGVEYGGECYCGNEINCGSYDVLDDSQCSMPCDGTPGEYCGGPDRLDMYMCGDISSTATSCPQPTTSSAAMTSSTAVSTTSSSSSLPSSSFAAQSSSSAAPSSSSFSAAASSTSSSSTSANIPSPSSSSLPAASSSSYAAASSTVSSSSSSIFSVSSSSYAAASSTIASSTSSSSSTSPSSSSSDPPPSVPTSSSTSSTTTLSRPVSISSSSLPPFSNCTTSSVPVSSTSSVVNPIVTSSSVASTTQTLTTSTVYTTTVYTITQCPATVTNCPIGKVTTDIISLYTTICPVKAAPTPKPAPVYTASTVYTTKVYTITSCAVTVTDCPAKIGQVTTETIALYTTVCPIEQSVTKAVIIPQANSTPASPASTLVSAGSLPSQGYSVAEKPSAYVGSPAASYTAIPVGSSVIAGGKIATSLSTYVATNGAVSAPETATAKPSTVYTGPTANGAARNSGVYTSLVVIVGFVALML